MMLKGTDGEVLGWLRDVGRAAWGPEVVRVLGVMRRAAIGSGAGHALPHVLVTPESKGRVGLFWICAASGRELDLDVGDDGWEALLTLDGARLRRCHDMKEASGLMLEMLVREDDDLVRLARWLVGEADPPPEARGARA